MSWNKTIPQRIFGAGTLMENFDQLVHTLAGYINLRAGEKELIQSIFKVVTYKKVEHVLSEGEVCYNLGFINKGIFRYYIEQEGEEKTYNFAKEGDFICNYESFIKQISSRKHIQAIEESEVLVISKDDLDRFYADVTDGNYFGRVHMQQVYAETVRQLIEQYTESPEARYLKFLKNHADLNQRIPQYYIASYVGVKPQSLSRIRKRLTAKVLY